MRPVPAARVFSASDAVALGWTSEALKHAVRTERLRRLRKGMYTAVENPGPVEHALAAARLSRHAAVSHRSAALVLSHPVLGVPPVLPELTVAPGRSRTDCRAHVYEATLSPTDVGLVDGARVTTPARTFVDVARHLPLDDAVVLGDAVLARATGLADIEDVLTRCWNWPGIRRAHRAIGLLDAAAESPLESLSRLTIDRGGLPRPSLQQAIHNEWNGFVARTDFYWDRFGVVGEADGATKYTSREALIVEKRRQERLEQLGLIVVRWGWREAVIAPHELIARLEAAFLRGLARDRSGLPRQWVLGPCPSTH